MTCTAPLLVDQRGDVRWLLLNRPDRRNALDEQLTAALEEQVEDIEHDDRTSVVVVAGEGPSFCAGGDFRHFLSLADGDRVVGFLSRLSACLARVEASPKPWVGALHGHAIAGGLELALVCDVVIAAEGTRIGDGHVNNHLLPGAGSAVRLERAIGKGNARWMHLSGESLSAEELMPTGWIRELVPAAALRDRAQALAAQLASRHFGTQQNMKRLLGEVWNLEQDDALARELNAFEANWTESDVPSALHGFLARRSGRSYEGQRS
ncbi:enoyl-CoA hydratase/isomerase family protein [Microbacterium sp. NPDC058062]|uniref:enoyl-CoA hydratase/isomerase family protein n=1 Tax=Microbacterium sp. NPDC058062 TaxID=3346320 RepID=UPI0036DB4C95